jgi:uncharacterized protein YqjF (DUF2071 family)
MFVKFSVCLERSLNEKYMSFLTAEWRKLAIINYAVDKKVLEKYLPHKTELDLWEDICYISLVGFMFKNVRLLGIPIPGHTNFEEVNLRFYVKRFDNGIWKRGVVFIKEFVPVRAVSFVANNFYGEHYQTIPMSHSWKTENDKLTIGYHWKNNQQTQSIEVTAKTEAQEISAESATEFITEHYWGYTKINSGKTFEYEVRHPRWKAYEVTSHKINVDFGLAYGEDFEFMNRLSPNTVMLAEGSEITVENKRTLDF